MATGDARGVSSMPLPPMQYVNMYTDDNVKKGKAPKPPPPVKVNAALSGKFTHGVGLVEKTLGSSADKLRHTQIGGKKNGTGCLPVELHMRGNPQLEGRKLVYPLKRCLAIRYVRLLLDDTALKVHQHRMKLVDSRECVCGHDIEYEDHFFFHCHRYSESRKQLMQAIQDIWSNTSVKGVLPQSVTLLLTPSSFSMFTTRQCQEILEATFQYIQQSGRRL